MTGAGAAAMTTGPAPHHPVRRKRPPHPRADTASGTGVGMAPATCLRFRGTRRLVFRHAGDIPVQRVSKADEG